MQIVVCVKQVLDSNNVRWSKENNLLREGMLSIINPYDDYAIEYALKIKEKYKSVNITVITMGPPQAKDVLEYALARGCDRAILLSDKAFSASDTLATGTTLSCAIKKYIPNYNLILCGQHAIDGDTAQTGPTISSLLDVPVITNVEDIINSDMKYSILKKKTKDGICIIESKNPSVVCVLKRQEKIEPLKIKDYIRAQDIKIETYGLEDLGLNRNEVGILGSPTYVYRAFKQTYHREPIEIKENIAQFLIDFIKCANEGKNE